MWKSDVRDSVKYNAQNKLRTCLWLQVFMSGKYFTSFVWYGLVLLCSFEVRYIHVRVEIHLHS